MRLFILCMCCIVFGSLHAEHLLVVDFETENAGYTLPNGGIFTEHDFFCRSFNENPAVTHQNFGEVQGVYYLAGKDIQRQTGFEVDGELMLADITSTSYENLQITFNLAAAELNEYESIISDFGSDYIIGEYSYNGMDWHTFAQFTGNHLSDEARMAEDTDLDGLGDGTVLGTNFQQFTYSIPNSRAILKIRFRMYTGSGKEIIALDNIRVTGDGVNTAPTAASREIEIPEDTEYIITESDLNYQDLNNDPLSHILITDLYEDNSVFLDRNDDNLFTEDEMVTDNDIITKNDLLLNRFKFRPAQDQNGAEYAAFNFKVNDGTVDSDNYYTITFGVNPVNDAPVITGQQELTTESGKAIALSVDNVTIEDPDSETFSLVILDGDNYTVEGNSITSQEDFVGDLTVSIQANDGEEKVLSEIYPLTINIVEASDIEPLIPLSIKLYQNFPNPFNPTTSIRYDLPLKSDVRIVVYNASGELVATLVDGNYNAGRHSVEWNAANVTSGIYYYHMKSGKYNSINKAILIK